MPDDQARLVFGGMVQQDWFGFAFTLLFIFGAAITAMFAMDHAELGKRGEFYVLMLVSVIGMCLMASAGDIVMLYLAIETTSIPLYILAGFMTKGCEIDRIGFQIFALWGLDFYGDVVWFQPAVWIDWHDQPVWM